jgi:hypothetical protein
MIFKLIPDNNNPKSIASSLRRKRNVFFKSLLSQLQYPITILDLGGTEKYWQSMGFCNREDVNITLINLSEYKTTCTNIKSFIGDARKLNFNDKSFDIVFSNSVIEHVGDINDQKRMAQEVKRVGKRYFIQTPNKYFVIEPHFLFPFFQFLPIRLRVWLVMNFSMGWFTQQSSSIQANNLVQSISLLSRKDLLGLFPGEKIIEEKIFGMIKSYIVYSGWD